MIKFIELYIGAIILWMAAYYVGILLLKPRNKISKIKIIFNILIFSILLVILNVVNSEIMHGIIKILITYILQCLFYKFIFNRPLTKSMVISLIWYLFLCLSEVALAIILSVFLTIGHGSLEFLKNTILINAMVSSINIIFIIRFQNILRKFLKNANIARSKYLVVVLILITLALLGYKIPVNNWKFSGEFIVTMMILIAFIIIGIFILKQNSSIEETMSKYRQEVKYSKVVSKVTAEYRKVNHEHKNELSVIRGMAVRGDNKKLLDYLDVLMEKKNDIRYNWSAELINLPLDGLKSLINYKLLEMEDLSINIILNISKDVAKINFNNLAIKKEDNLYNIVGIYLDNAMQASSESTDKKVSIDIYKEKKNLVFIIGNTYKGKIDIDRIDEYGYTTKGKNHGVGLSIVKSILEEDSIFVQERNIVENYYIQKLIIDVPKMKNRKKKTTK